MKHCKSCNLDKQKSCFNFRSDLPHILRSNCKECCIKKALLRARANGRKPRTKMSDEEQKLKRKQSLQKYRSTPSYKIKHAIRQADRRAKKLQATPKWLNDSQKAHIACYYELAQILSDQMGIKWTVDHIVPLEGREVKGLHVPWNLQLMVLEANSSKGNRIWSK